MDSVHIVLRDGEVVAVYSDAAEAIGVAARLNHQARVNPDTQALEPFASVVEKEVF